MSYNQDAVIDPDEEIYFFWGGYQYNHVLKIPGHFLLERLRGPLGILSLCADPTNPQEYTGQEISVMTPKIDWKLSKNQYPQINWQTGL